MEEEESEMYWRKRVDFNLKRLHSLLFGADLALNNSHFSSAQLLSLRLIGFLDSHSHSDLDDSFIRPIRREVLSKLDTARRSLIPESDRYSLSLSLSTYIHTPMHADCFHLGIFSISYTLSCY